MNITIIYNIQASHPTQIPAADTLILYPYTDGKWYTKDHAETIKEFGGGGGHEIIQNLTAFAQRAKLNFKSSSFKIIDNEPDGSTDIELIIDSTAATGNPNSGIREYTDEEIFYNGEFCTYTIDGVTNFYECIAEGGSLAVHRLTVELTPIPSAEEFLINYIINLAGRAYTNSYLDNTDSNSLAAQIPTDNNYIGWTVVNTSANIVDFTATVKGTKETSTATIGTFTVVDAGNAGGITGINPTNTGSWKLSSFGANYHVHPNKPQIDLVNAQTFLDIAYVVNHAIQQGNAHNTKLEQIDADTLKSSAESGGVIPPAQMTWLGAVKKKPHSFITAILSYLYEHIIDSSIHFTASSLNLSSKVDANTAITGSTKTKITYDAKGLVTSGADATKTDIGLSDVTNDKQIKANASSTNLNIPAWDGTTGDKLTGGYALQDVILGKATLVAGSYTVTDTAITTQSMAIALCSTTGALAGVLKYTAASGYLTFVSTNNSDTATFSYIIFP